MFITLNSPAMFFVSSVVNICVFPGGPGNTLVDTFRSTTLRHLLWPNGWLLCWSFSDEYLILQQKIEKKSFYQIKF